MIRYHRTDTSIVRVCRQTYYDARQIPWEKRHFVLFALKIDRYRNSFSYRHRYHISGASRFVKRLMSYQIYALQEISILDRQLPVFVEGWHQALHRYPASHDSELRIRLQVYQPGTLCCARSVAQKWTEYVGRSLEIQGLSKFSLLVNSYRGHVIAMPIDAASHDISRWGLAFSHSSFTVAPALQSMINISCTVRKVTIDVRPDLVTEDSEIELDTKLRIWKIDASAHEVQDCAASGYFRTAL